MGIKEDIEFICSFVKDYTIEKKDEETAERVLGWINSPSCPLIDAEELETEVYDDRGNDNNEAPYWQD